MFTRTERGHVDHEESIIYIEEYILTPLYLLDRPMCVCSFSFTVKTSPN